VRQQSIKDKYCMFSHTRKFKKKKEGKKTNQHEWRTVITRGWQVGKVGTKRLNLIKAHYTATIKIIY
jgi:hypothetical protein